MNKKTIIQIVIIMAAFGASGLVLYNGLFKNSGSISQEDLLAGSAPAGTTEKILPYGDKMDFKAVLQKQNLQFGIIDYPLLDPSREVGIPAEKLILLPEIISPSPK